MSNKLKLCAHCGGDARLDTFYKPVEALTIRCQCCNISLYGNVSRPEEAIAVWNTRSGPAWQDRPTVPGRWLYEINGRLQSIVVTEEDIDGNYYSSSCFGPIPERPIPDDAGGVT